MASRRAITFVALAMAISAFAGCVAPPPSDFGAASTTSPKSTVLQSATTRSAVTATTVERAETTTPSPTTTCTPAVASPQTVAQATKTFVPFIEAIINDDQQCADALTSDHFTKMGRLGLGDRDDPNWITFHPKLSGQTLPSFQQRLKPLTLPIDPSKITATSYIQPVIVKPGEPMPTGSPDDLPHGFELAYPVSGNMSVRADLAEDHGRYLVDAVLVQ